MNWQQLCENTSFRNMPYKIELNNIGQIIMSPARLAHGAFQSDIDRLLSKSIRRKGKIVIECAILTQEGTKVADVAWFSAARWEQVKDEFESPVAPEICVEVVSSGNTRSEMNTKKRLYFAAGAEEVWFCSESGKMNFYVPEGKLKTSLRVPKFPQKIA